MNTAPNITYVSTRGRGLDTNLRLVKRDLTVRFPEAAMRFFIKDNTATTALKELGMTRDGRNFFDLPGTYITTDSFYKGKPKQPSAQVLITVPYVVWFKDALAREAGGGPAGRWKSQSHILSSCRFTTEMLENFYDTTNAEIIECPSPLAWDLQHGGRHDDIRQQLYSYFPAAEGKKLLVFKSGRQSPEALEIYREFPLRKLLDQCGTDWFMVTDSHELFPALNGIPGRYADRFGFVDHIMSTTDMLYLADALITASDHQAAAYAARRKPILLLPYTDTDFEKYAAKHFADLFLQDPNTLPERFAQLEQPTAGMEKFFDTFTSPVQKSPFEVLERIVQGQNQPVTDR